MPVMDWSRDEIRAGRKKAERIDNENREQRYAESRHDFEKQDFFGSLLTSFSRLKRNILYLFRTDSLAERNVGRNSRR